MIEGLGSSLLPGVPTAAPAATPAGPADAGAEPGVAAEFAAILAGWLSVAPASTARVATTGSDGATSAEVAGADESDAVGEGGVEEQGEGDAGLVEGAGVVIDAGAEERRVRAVAGGPVPVVAIEGSAPDAAESAPEPASSPVESSAGEDAPRDPAPEHARPTFALASSLGAALAARAEAVMKGMLGESPRAVRMQAEPRAREGLLATMGNAPEANVPVPALDRVAAGSAEPVEAAALRTAATVEAVPSEAGRPDEPVLQRAVSAVVETMSRWGAALDAAETDAAPRLVPAQSVPTVEPAVEERPSDAGAGSRGSGITVEGEDLAAALRVHIHGGAASTRDDGADVPDDGGKGGGGDRATPVAGFTLLRSTESAVTPIGPSRAGGATAPPETPASDAPPRMVTLRFDGPDGLEQRIRVSVFGESVRATILTDGRSAAQMERALPDLHRSLAEHGFRDAQVGIRVLGAEAPVHIASRQEAAASGDSGRQRDDQAAPDGRRRDAPGEDRPRDRRQPSGEEAHR